MPYRVLLIPVLCALCMLTSCSAPEAWNPAQPAIIPLPQAMEVLPGGFSLSANTRIVYTPAAEATAFYLRDALAGAGLVVAAQPLDPAADYSEWSRYTSKKGFPESGTIALICPLPQMGSTMHKEGYQLEVAEREVLLMALDEVGLFRGVQSLLQLLPAHFYESERLLRYDLPALSITDYPQFAHRGMLLDVCRHFFTVSEVKAYIDLLAFYKMNTLHWHLTDDQGWRIAIDAYPKLTEVGAWRTEADGSTYGGFYSKNDIREVVAYAASRHINIIPEIELPGHAQAALSAYPQFSCTGGPHSVANDWGVFKEIYCAGNDSTFVFLRQVLAEVMELFPSPYIHIGGDEAPKYRWEQCAKCKKRLAQHGLHDAHALQSWFIGEVGKSLSENGRTLIGWDEILEGGLPPQAVVQSWRGMEGGTAAAHAGQYAIMSPTSHCYFDYDVRSIDLERAYKFNPIPENLPRDLHPFILGGACNLWTEHIPDKATLDRQAFPRLLAMSEALWTASAARDFPDFRDRVALHYPILQSKGVQYGAETVPFTAHTAYRDTTFTLELRNRQPGTQLMTATNGKVTSATYVNPIPFPLGAHHLRVTPLRNGAPAGEVQSLHVYVHRGHTAKVSLAHPHSPNYTAGGMAGLTDGLLGTSDFRDGRWMGFEGTDFEAVVDLGHEIEVGRMSINALQYNNAWIFLPTEVEFFTSVNGSDFTSAGEARPQQAPDVRGQFTERFSVAANGQPARYMKVVARNIRTVPRWHEAAGADAWLFIDEISIE